VDVGQSCHRDAKTGLHRHLISVRVPYLVVCSLNWLGHLPFLYDKKISFSRLILTVFSACASALSRSIFFDWKSDSQARFKNAKFADRKGPHVHK
jgi:hypothetical protein